MKTLLLLDLLLFFLLQEIRQRLPSMEDLQIYTHSIKFSIKIDNQVHTNGFKKAVSLKRKNKT